MIGLKLNTYEYFCPLEVACRGSGWNFEFYKLAL